MTEKDNKFKKNAIYIGCVLDIEKKKIELIPKTSINDIDTDGLELEYTRDIKDTMPIKFKPKEIINSISSAITGEPFNIEDTIDTIPIPFLASLGKKLSSGDLVFEKIHYKMPNKEAREKAVTAINTLQTGTIPKDTTPSINRSILEKIKDTNPSQSQIQDIKDGQTTETFAMSLTWEDDSKDKITIGGLSLSGIYIGITNELAEDEYGTNLFNLEKNTQ